MKCRAKIIPFSPSSPFDLESVKSGLALLRSNGFNTLEPRLPPRTVPYYLCGDDKARVSELELGLRSSPEDILWATRGGYGLTRILPDLSLPEGPLPVVVGFSDISSLHLHLWKHRRARGIHGPMLSKLSLENPASLQSLWNILNGVSRETKWPLLKKLFWPKIQDIEGTLIVTNLCVLTHLIGTSSFPDLAGTILVLEDLAEPPYKLDRMLTQLWHSGSLEGVRAILLGHFTACAKECDHKAEFFILERCKSFGIPLCSGLPVGHESPNWAIPFGVRARLTGETEISFSVLQEVF